MLRRNQDSSKNFEIYSKGSRGNWVFVGFGEVVGEKITKETKKFIYFENHKIRKPEDK